MDGQQEKEKTIWDLVDDISFSKKVIADELDVDTFEKLYIPFLVNRSLSQHIDTVIYANEMNKNSWLPKRLQYDFFIRSIRQRKRFGKWAKASESDGEKIVCEYYNCSVRKAREFLKILSEEEISVLKERMEKGGLRKR